MEALVTGGSGFIGARLIERLRQEGASVCALVRPGGSVRPVPQDVPCIEADFSDPNSACKAFAAAGRPQVVFHAAMPSGHPASAAERLETLMTAVAGTAHLAEAAAEAGVRRFVFLGSFLGYRPQAAALKETDPFDPATPRGAAKAAASLWLRQFARSHALPAVELRIFSVYGPGEAAHRFIPTLLNAARTGEAVRLLPGSRRDLVYVDDVVDACLRAAQEPIEPGAAFNIGGGASWSNEEVLVAAREASGEPIPVLAEPYPAKAADGCWLADITAARQALGWQPRRSLTEGLRETYRCLN